MDAVEIKACFEEENEGERLIDAKWNVSTMTLGNVEVLEAVKAGTAITVSVFVSKRFVKLTLDPKMHTDALGATERMRLYRKVLLFNSDFNMIKAGLIGENQDIIFSVDAERDQLDREGLARCLEYLVQGAKAGIEAMGM